MNSMSVMTDDRGSQTGEHKRRWTVRDLGRIPDDGNRYELIDGELFVTPAPAPHHQQIVAQLAFRLEMARLPHLVVLAAPVAVTMSHRTEVQPDVLVAAFEDFTAKNLPKPPVLAVEVLSPSTALNDLNKKKNKYQRFKVPNYWVIDPLEPSLTAFELDEHGTYRIIAKVAGDEPFEASAPFPVRVVLTELLGPFVNR